MNPVDTLKVMREFYAGTPLNHREKVEALDAAIAALNGGEARAWPRAAAGMDGLVQHAMKLAERWQACMDAPDLRHTLRIIAERLALPGDGSAPCPCGEFTCTEPWEPGCGLGKSEAHVAIAGDGSAEVEAIDWRRLAAHVWDALACEGLDLIDRESVEAAVQNGLNGYYAAAGRYAITRVGNASTQGEG